MVNHVLSVHLCIDAREKHHGNRIDCQVARRENCGENVAIPDYQAAVLTAEVGCCCCRLPGAATGEPYAVGGKGSRCDGVQNRIYDHSVLMQLVLWQLLVAWVGSAEHYVKRNVLEDEVGAADQTQYTCHLQV